MHAHMGEISREACTMLANTSVMVVCGSASTLSPQMMAACANDGLSFVLGIWRLKRFSGELEASVRRRFRHGGTYEGRTAFPWCRLMRVECMGRAW